MIMGESYSISLPHFPILSTGDPVRVNSLLPAKPGWGAIGVLQEDHSNHDQRLLKKKKKK